MQSIPKERSGRKDVSNTSSHQSLADQHKEKSNEHETDFDG